jgi:hypothetical protein
MNGRQRDRIALSSAVVMGLGISTGYPLGIVAAAGMPVACLAPGTRKRAFQNAFGYYIAALWPMVFGLDRYFRPQVTLAVPLAIWVLAAVMLSLPWTIAATPHRVRYLWRAPLALLATVIPPLGVIGLASPLTAAGYLFPGTAWAGIVAVVLTAGILLATGALTFRRGCVVQCFVITLCTGLAIGGRCVRSGDPEPPRDWVAVNTHFGDVSQPFRDFLAAQFIQQRAAASSARVLIFPEAVVPRWSEATEAFWRRSLDRCRTRGQILAVGAGLPARPRGTEDHRQKYTDLKLYDFGPAIDALRVMETTPLHTVQAKPRPEPTDNTMLVVGSESATFYQRVPVPVRMWQPFDP